MTVHFTIRPVTEWLALAAVCVFVLGVVLTFVTGEALELGAFVFAWIGTVIAVILLLLALGSMF